MIDNDVVQCTICSNGRVPTYERLVEFRVGSDLDVVEETAFGELSRGNGEGLTF